MDEPPGPQAPEAPATETRPFQAEMKQLLDLFVRSLYSSKEVFLRELISNASDALDRLRFEALTTPGIREEGELEIRLETDPKNRTLTILDNGIGMSREEVIANIGTIARSGTRELFEKIKGSTSSDQALALIGQFGVGFYSAFMVADKLSLRTRRAGTSAGTLWESTGDGTYTIGNTQMDKPGTAITMHLKPVDPDDGMPDFTDERVLSNIVRKYSDFVRYPIRMKMTREETGTDPGGEPYKDVPRQTVVEDKTLNSMKAIWLRKPQEVTDEEYSDFYKHISHDWEKPLKTITFSAEGRLEYRALLFIPSRAPFELDLHGLEGGLQLFSQNVKIIEKCEDLLPRYLQFVKGVVDSSDLSLNVSREMLQQDRLISQIRKRLVKKILDVLTEMQEKEADVYRKFWNAFGRALKEGVSADHENREKLLALLLFESSADAEKLTTLKEYVGRMKEAQEGIYYLAGEPRSLIESSPHLEMFRARGFEVIYLADPIDDLMVHTVSQFSGKRLESAATSSLDPRSKEDRNSDESQRKEREAEHANLFRAIQKHLDRHVKEVRLSTRLTTSPVSSVTGPSPRGSNASWQANVVRSNAASWNSTQTILS